MLKDRVPLDRTFFALADPTRRAILTRLERDDASLEALSGIARLTTRPQFLRNDHTRARTEQPPPYSRPASAASARSVMAAAWPANPWFVDQLPALPKSMAPAARQLTSTQTASRTK